jgi:hypothetical protein
LDFVFYVVVHIRVGIAEKAVVKTGVVCIGADINGFCAAAALF